MRAAKTTSEPWLAGLSERYGDGPPLFDAAAIEQMIPHRVPFLMVDQIVEFERSAARIIGRKRVSEDEEVLRGHFPQAPIFPGVLIVEALAQTGGVLIHLMGQSGKIPMIVRLERAAFRHPVTPPSDLFTICEGIHLTARGGRMATRAVIGDRVCATAEISYVLTEVDQLNLSRA